MRRGRIQFFKFAIGITVVLVICYFLFSDSNAHNRAKKAFTEKFIGDKPRERPVLVKGRYHWIAYILWNVEILDIDILAIQAAGWFVTFWLFTSDLKWILNCEIRNYIQLETQMIV